jgi:large subunit ribosomal protein L25
MKKAIPFSANARAEGENPKHLRKAGSVPAIVYGNAHKSASIKCSAKEFHNVYLKAGENTIVELDVDGKKVPCLIHSVTLDP